MAEKLPSEKTFPAQASSYRFEDIDAVCNEFEAAWRDGAQPRLEDYLMRVPDDLREELFAELLMCEVQLLGTDGRHPEPKNYLERFPGYSAYVRRYFGGLPTQGATVSRPSETAAGSHPTSPFFTRLRGYELLGKIGAGGMGMVYKARQVSADRIVALKVIRSNCLPEPKTGDFQKILSRFRVEAEAAARLQHDNVVTIYDVGEVDGQPYYAMRFVEGESLDGKLRAGPLQPQQAATYLRQIADAVAAAHAEGILHRDLKPHNVLIDAKTDRALLTDFGLAKLTATDRGLTAMDERVVFGSPSYMSPEQARHSSRVTEATDVYGLGATLYHALTGSPPFQAVTPRETLRLVEEREPIPPRRQNPTIPKDLETICLKCLRKEPLRRYRSARELAEDLGRWQRNEPIRARRVGLAEQGWLWCRRRPAVAGLLVALLILLPLISGIALERNRATRATALVDGIIASDVEEIPRLVRELEGYRYWGNPRLRSEFERHEDGSTEKLRAALALLPADASKKAYLQSQLPKLEPEELLVVRNALTKPRTEEIRRLWNTLEDEGQNDRARFNSACLLAAWDAKNVERWENAGSFVAAHAARQLARSPGNSPTLVKLLDPVGDQLANPLAESARNKSLHPAAQQMALNLLLKFGGNQIEVLCGLLLEAEPQAFEQILLTLKPYATRAAAILQVETQKTLGDLEDEAAKERLGRQQAAAAMALLHLDVPAGAWDVLRQRTDPRARSYFIDRAATYGVPAEALIAKLLDKDVDVSIRHALLLTLGEYDKGQLSLRQRQRLVPKILDLYRRHPDAGLHAAAEWLLRRWGQEEVLVAQRAKLQETGSGFDASRPMNRRRWYVNRQGQTMVVVAGETFLMGSRVPDPQADATEIAHRKRIGREFALSATPVSKAQFARFQKSEFASVADVTTDSTFRATVLTDDSPMVGVSWYDVAAYCNWLSKQEGIPEGQWCYVPNAAGKYAAGMRAKPVYLRLKGYRLASEAEWEYACRAGATTKRFYGTSDDLLGEYAWYVANSPQRTRPVGWKKPNDFGLFDMHGNVWTWCHDSYVRAFETAADYGDALAVKDAKPRALRGGAFNMDARLLRASGREKGQPNHRMLNTGFRVARTCQDYAARLPVQLKPIPADCTRWSFDDDERNSFSAYGDTWADNWDATLYEMQERTDQYIQLYQAETHVWLRLTARQALWSVDGEKWRVLAIGKAEHN